MASNIILRITSVRTIDKNSKLNSRRDTAVVADDDGDDDDEVVGL